MGSTKHLQQAAGKTKIQWDTRLVSFAQAAFISYQALSAIFTDPTQPDATVHENLWTYSTHVGKVQSYAVAYFLGDLCVSTRCASLYGPGTAVHAFCAFFVTMLGFASVAQETPYY